MSKTPAHPAAIANPALDPFKPLIGKWKTTGSHPMVPGKTFHGHTSFEWMEGGAFIIMHSQIEEKEIPAGIAILGSDDATEEYFMIYFDERKISRKYNLEVSDKVIRWWRDDPKFRQRNTLTFSADGKTIIGVGEMSKDGKEWEGDLELTYTRI